MWGQVLTAGIALLGVLVTTKVLAGGHARARHRLKDELELIDQIPKELAGRPVFEEYVSESLQAYVDAQRRGHLTLGQLKRQAWAANALVVLGFGAVCVWAQGLIEAGVMNNPRVFSELTLAGWMWLAVVGPLSFSMVVLGAHFGKQVATQRALRDIQLKREQQSALE